MQITFGVGENTFHLILEFYAQGNVILTDKSYEVLTLLRSHRDDAKGMATMARHTYPIHTVRLRQPLPAELLETALSAAGEDATLKTIVSDVVPYGQNVAEHCLRKAKLEAGRLPAAAPLTKEESVDLMAAIREFEKWLDACETEGSAAPGGVIFTRPAAAAAAAVSSSSNKSGDGGDDDDEQRKIDHSSKINDEENNTPPAAAAAVVYEEYEPLLENGLPFASKKDTDDAFSQVKFPTFDAAIAEFYGKVHGQRAVAQQAQREKVALGKLDAIKRDHESRLENLSVEVDAAERRAMLIELNLTAVDAALNAVREALGGGMDWRDLGRMIKEEKKAGNPVAALIDSLQLEKNKITVLLRDPLEDDDDEDDEDDGDKEEDEVEGGEEQAQGKKKKQNEKKKKGKLFVEKIEVDLELSAYANARAHYDTRKKHADKARRTLEANERALAAAEKKAQDNLAKVRSAGGKTSAIAVAAAARKPYWFERFYWFISSENYLVISGRDAQQNEIIVKRYLTKGDVYVHADLHGASSTIIKNSNPTAPIPPLTLSQAGQACVSRSAAWDAKVVTSAYWVYPDQVSKTAPTGEYLTTGSFMIRGRKNYLPPQPLVMGVAWLFKLEEESVAGHVGERAPRLDLVAAVTTDETAEDGDDDEDDEDEEDEGVVEQVEKPEQKKSALDAFMESSVDALLPQPPKITRATTTAEEGAAAAAVYSRYGLADVSTTTATTTATTTLEEELDGAASVEAATGEETAASSSSSRRHLSAKERQLLKKGVQPEEVAERITLQKQQKKAAPPRLASEKQQQEAAAMRETERKQLLGVRGAKGKAARKSKYAEQDEDERELAMALLQSRGQTKDRKQRKEERKAKMASRKAAKTGLEKVEVTEEDIAKLTARLAVEDVDDDDEEEEEEGEEEEKSENGGGDGSPTKIDNDDDGDNDEDNDAERERDEVAEVLASEGISVLEDAEKERLTQLDELTGVPRPEDVVLYAVPMCAPYQVVANYNYKVKLVPGTLKKGKAFRQAVELIAGRGGVDKSGGDKSGVDAAAAVVSIREKEMIRAVPEADGINAMIGGVKLQMAGLQKMQQAKKKKKAGGGGGGKKK